MKRSMKKGLLPAVFVLALILGMIVCPNAQAARTRRIVLNRSSVTIARGEVFQLEIKAALPITIGVDPERVTWTSGNEAVITVDKRGLVSAVGQGTATVKCVYEGVSVKCKIKVIVPLTGFSLDRVSVRMTAGTKTKIAAAGFAPLDTTSKKKAAWRSSDPKTATVTKNGMVKAVKAGRATITCTIDGIARSCAVEVISKEQAYIASVLELVNAERAKGGAKPLALYEPLSLAAALRARELRTRFSHDRPDGSGFYTVIPYRYRSAGENIAYGYGTPAKVMKAWMNSQSHRENILDPAFEQIGIGYYLVGGKPYWVQLFTALN